MLEVIHNFGYLGIFATIFGEIGGMLFFLPGDTLIFGSGLLAHTGVLNFNFVIFIVFLASALGGHFGYFLGTKINRETLINNKYYKIKDTHLEKTEKFFEKYGDLAITISRFVPVVRNLISQLCGILNYDKRKFFIYNILASFIWPAITVTLGFYFGKMFPNFIVYIEIFMVVMIAIIAAPFFIEVLKKIFRKRKR